MSKTATILQMEMKKATQLTFLSIKSVLAATDNFSDANKLGEGGFGPVYKGVLLPGDRGMARIFQIDQGEANTNHIVGTYGYMSPEYAIYGGSSRRSRERKEEHGFHSIRNSILPSFLDKSKKMSQFRTPSTKQRNTKKQEVVIKIAGCTAFLMDEGEALELASGEFRIARVVDNKGGFPIATVVKVGKDLQWPLTRDEPVVKLDSFHYLFSLPMRDGCPLSYGLTFSKQQGKHLAALDSFLDQNSCFSASGYGSDSESVRNNGGRNKSSGGNLEWKQLAPRIEDYNNVLARGIAEGTLQIVRGIFMCSNVYSNLVHRCAEMILNGGEINSYKKPVVAQNGNGGAKKGLKRARELSKMTEEVSKAMLEGANMATGSVMGPVLNSQPGKTILATLPGELLLASLDAINKILDAAEAAEKQALAATTTATTRVVSQRYGEGAAETTGDVLATAGHCANTAWNVVKFRKAINPASSVATGVHRNNNRNY